MKFALIFSLFVFLFGGLSYSQSIQQIKKTADSLTILTR